VAHFWVGNPKNVEPVSDLEYQNYFLGAFAKLTYRIGANYIRDICCLYIYFKKLRPSQLFSIKYNRRITVASQNN